MRMYAHQDMIYWMRVHLRATAVCVCFKSANACNLEPFNPNPCDNSQTRPKTKLCTWARLRNKTEGSFTVVSFRVETRCGVHTLQHEALYQAENCLSWTLPSTRDAERGVRDSSRGMRVGA